MGMNHDKNGNINVQILEVYGNEWELLKGRKWPWDDLGGKRSLVSRDQQMSRKVDQIILLPGTQILNQTETMCSLVAPLLLSITDSMNIPLIFN